MPGTFRPFLVSAALLTGACGAPEPEPAATPPADPAVVEAEIGAALAAFREASLANDAEAVLALYTEDAAVSQADFDLAGDKMRAALRQLLESAPYRGFDVRTSERFVHGDVVYERGEYDEQMEMGGQQMNVEGFYFIRWEKGPDGKWRIDRLTAGPRSLTPPAP